MAFLIPALIALSGDVSLLVIRRMTPGSESWTGDGNSDDDLFVYHVGYLYPLAVIRILLLGVPLLFHSYTGTAIQCPLAYQTLYWVTLLVLLVHMLSLAILNPTSLESFLPLQATTQTVFTWSGFRLLLEHAHALRRIWWTLTLSLLSDVCHLVIFSHVKSSAPSSYGHYPLFWSSYGNTTRHPRQPSVYYALRTGSIRDGPYNGMTGAANTTTEACYADDYNENAPYHRSHTATGAHPTNGHPAQGSPMLFNPRLLQNHHDSSTEPALMHAMSDFVVELRTRIQRAKTDWAARLEDFTLRGSATAHYHPLPPAMGFGEVPSSTSQGGGGIGAATAATSTAMIASRSTSSSSSHASPVHPFFFQLTPFRVLLQLFAYEDVLDNGKLDAVFELDDGTALTFFVPQLLSFLLHGALQCSPQLEYWILDKCRRNVYFAHRCYWFLRAWCLLTPSAGRNGSNGTKDGGGPLTAAGATAAVNTFSNQRSHSEPMLSDGKVCVGPFLDEPQSPAHGFVDCGGTNSRRDSRRSSTNSTPFFVSEERMIIERLMMRVQECGEQAARVLSFGPTLQKSHRPHVQRLTGVDANSTPKAASFPLPRHGDFAHTRNPLDGSVEDDGEHVASSVSTNHQDHRPWIIEDFPETGRFPPTPDAMADAAKKGFIPSHPYDGSPSVQHYKVLSSPRRYGFLTVDNQADTINGSNMNQTFSPPAISRATSATEHFDRTSHFLDALLALADDLFQVPRDNRKMELRKRLRSLECSLLPSNCIYLPIGNVRHRVWRIVADESIAISTKERVPCIICLEVVDSHLSPSSFSRHKQGWTGLLDRLPRPYRRTHSADNVSAGQEEIVVPVEQRTAGTPSRSQVSPLEAAMGLLSEPEMVEYWRDAPRNPQRRTSLFEKVTSRVQTNVQVVQEHLNQYRDRSASEEMRSLTLAESLVGSFPPTELMKLSPQSSPAASRQIIADLRDHPNLITLGQKTEAPQSGNSVLSRTSSSASFTSMGQWSSPNKKESFAKDRGNKLPRRSDRPTESVSTISQNKLPYGSVTSDHDEEAALSPTMSAAFERKTGFLPPAPQTVEENGTKKSSRPPPVVFREDWRSKEDRIRAMSAYGSHPGWRLLPVLVKSNDDLRQEQLASQIIYKMASILAREKVPVWLRNYEIIALTGSGGIIEAIPDTISLDSLKKNDPKFTNLRDFFHSHYHADEEIADAKANFVESLAAYSIVCFLMQIKDRHNGNILLDNRGHIIHIDFGFFFLSSPGKNAGFESAPFKLTRDFVELLDGPHSHLFRTFRDLCCRTFLALRRNWMELILLVEMLKNGNEELKCFRGRPDEAIEQFRERFRLDLNDRACREYVNALVDDSVENWRTDWYDRYQRYFVGVL